jgi:hypothetical protein
MEQISRDLGNCSKTEQLKPAKTASNPKGAPPFDAVLVRRMIGQSLHGPKGRVVARVEVEDWQIHKLVGVLNSRAAMYAATLADQDRARRRDKAVALIAELRALLPLVVKDSQQWKEFFGRNTSRAAKELCDVVLSDLPKRALPQIDLPTSGEGYRWVAPTLYRDLKDLLGANAALRFVHAVLPKVSGQSPSLPTIKLYLKQNQSG